jgi:hypothetical protein
MRSFLASLAFLAAVALPSAAGAEVVTPHTVAPHTVTPHAVAPEVLAPEAAPAPNPAVAEPSAPSADAAPAGAPAPVETAAADRPAADPGDRRPADPGPLRTECSPGHHCAPLEPVSFGEKVLGRLFCPWYSASLSAASRIASANVQAGQPNNVGFLSEIILLTELTQSRVCIHLREF